MERQLKERVVGAVLLVLAAVLIIPLFLDGPDPGTAETRPGVVLPPAEDTDVRTRTVRLEQSRDTPTAPPISEPPGASATAASQPDTSAADTPGDVADPPTQGASEPQEDAAAPPQPEPEPDVPAAQPTPTPQPATPPASASPPPAAPAATPDSGSWVVQLGSFGSRDNAQRLVDDLRDKRYQSFVTRVDVDGRTLHRVRVGPGGAREEADRLLERLRADGYSGQAVPE